MSGLIRALSALVCTAMCVFVQAQEYPARPVRLVVPYSAGGGIDSIARAIGQRLSEAWGQRVLVENKPGASAIIGMDYVAKSAADGYTLLWSDTNVVVNSFLFSKLPYDPFRDFAPITQLVDTYIGLAVNTSLPVKNMGWARVAKAARIEVD